MSEIVIRLEGLTKKFGSNFAVKDLSFEVKRGDLFGFLGPNGAGKSTTLYILLGLVYPTFGRALIFEKSPSDLESVRPRIGSLIETPSFYPYLSAKKNLEQSARLLGPDALKTVPDALLRVGLSRAARMKVRHFSSGMKQRLGVARALLGNPDLLILDEPTNGLDPVGTELAWRLLKQFTREEGKTVLVSSHLLFEIEEHCNRVCVISEGNCLACGEVSSLLQTKNKPIEVICGEEESAERLRRLIDRETWIREAGDGKTPLHFFIACENRSPVELHNFLVQNDIRLVKFAPVRQTLRDFFLSLTNSKK